MPDSPTAPPEATVYAHPSGKRIFVMPDGSMECWKPNGSRGTTSATPEKLAAGHGAWQVTQSPDPAAAPAAEATPPPSAAPLAMTYASTERATDPSIYALIRDPHVVVEQKFDGTRCLVVLDTGSGRSRFYGRNSQPLRHSAAAQHFGRIGADLGKLLGGTTPGEVVLDGELMIDTGVYVVFDVVWMRFGGVNVSGPTDPLWRRRAVLETLVPLTADGAVRLARQETTADGKARLWTEVVNAGGEGLMVKHRDSAYEPGVRVRHSLKVKLVKTADVVVIERDVDGAKNATLGVLGEDGEVVRVGNCSMIGKPNAMPGDVIEVAYLYWTGSRLYQPRMVKARRDKSLLECGLDQFSTYSKAVL